MGQLELQVVQGQQPVVLVLKVLLRQQLVVLEEQQVLLELQQAVQGQQLVVLEQQLVVCTQMMKKDVFFPSGKFGKINFNRI